LRSGPWKLHFPHAYPTMAKPGTNGQPGSYRQTKIDRALFDLRTDPGETRDVAGKHPDVVKRLEALAEKAREDLGDSATGRKGRNVREPGYGTTGSPIRQKK
jgi:arylsulfatase A